MMITSFTIFNFRAFHHLRLSGFERVNLIAGRNNVGKTALLEALWQFTGPDVPGIGLRLNRFRGIVQFDSKEFSFDLFHQYNIKEPIRLAADGDWGMDKRSLQIAIRPRAEFRTPLTKESNGINLDVLDEESPHEIVLRYSDETGDYESTGHIEALAVDSNTVNVRLTSHRQPIPARPSNVYFGPHNRLAANNVAELFGQLERQGHEMEVVEAVQTFEPHVRRLTIIPVDDVPMIHADMGFGRLMPVGLLGDGVQRVLSLALVFTTASGGLVLVDEFENGIHHSQLEDLWRVVSAFSERYDTQVFATTHSEECVRAAHHTFTEAEEYDFRFYRLDRVNGEIKAKTLDRTLLETALQASLEVR